METSKEKPSITFKIDSLSTSGFGGWYFQAAAQKIGRAVWNRVCELTGARFHLDFEHPAFDTLTRFRDLMYRQHRHRYPDSLRPGLALITGEGDSALSHEASLMAGYLDWEPETDGLSARAEELEYRGDSVFQIGGTRVTAVFSTVSTEQLLELQDSGRAGGLPEAISEGLVVNQAGMAPLSCGGILEALSSNLDSRVSAGTSGLIPWTRRFYSRGTTGPGGSPIEELPHWTHNNWHALMLRPERNTAGGEIMAGILGQGPEECIRLALEAGGYQVQQLAAPGDRAFVPVLDAGEDKPVFHRQPAALRLLVSEQRLLGLLASCGGFSTHDRFARRTVQPLAYTGSPGKDTMAAVIEIFGRLSADKLRRVRETASAETESQGFPAGGNSPAVSLVPRIISRGLLAVLEGSAEILRRDTGGLLDAFIQGELDSYICLSERERGLALDSPRVNGWPMLLAFDSLFSGSTVDCTP